MLPMLSTIGVELARTNFAHSTHSSNWLNDRRSVVVLDEDAAGRVRVHECDAAEAARRPALAEFLAAMWYGVGVE